MKTKICLIAVLISINITTSGQAPSWHWIETFGSSSYDGSRYMTGDIYGNLYATGFFTGTVDFDPSPNTFNLTSSGATTFILKLNAGGGFVWAKQINGIGTDYISMSSVDSSGSVYIAGYFEYTVDFDPGPGIFNMNGSHLPWGGSDVFILKLDSTGNFVWAKQFGGTESEGAKSVVSDPSGNIYTIGKFTLPIDFDPGIGTFMLGSDFTVEAKTFVSKLDSSGNFVWAKAIGIQQSSMLNGTVLPASMDLDNYENLYITGSIGGTIDFDPDTGIYYLTSPPYIFILKLNSSGNFVWVKSLGDDLDAFKVVASTNIYTTGYYNGTVDFDPGPGIFNLTAAGFNYNAYILKWDSSGNFIWAKDFKGKYCKSYSLGLDSSENIYTTGVFVDTIDFDPGPGVFNLSSISAFGFEDDVFISKLDSSGNFLWAKSINGTAEEDVNSIVVDSPGNVYLAGSFSSAAVSFDSLMVNNTTPPYSDIFIAKIGNTPTGISDQLILSNLINIFPNPGSGQINITSCKVIDKIEITNTLGQTIYHATPKDKNISLHLFRGGIYFVAITSGNQITIGKIIVQK